MSERPSSPSTEFAPPTPPAMPVATLRGKRRANAHDENGSSRIPIASPRASTATTKTVTTVAEAPRTPKVYLQGGKDAQPGTEKPKSCIPFPTSSAPAPPVLTTTHAGFADIAYRLLNAPKSPRKDSGKAKSSTSNSTPALGRRTRPDATRTKVAKGKKPVVPTSPPLWRVLQASRKGVIAETLDYELLGTLPYSGSMVTPSMLREGLLTPDTAYHAWVGAKRAIEERPGGEWELATILNSALQFYLVELGASMLDRVDGPHYTFADPRLHDNPPAMVKHALRLTRLFVEKGYGRDRIVVTIPATEAGVQAARVLEHEHGVQTNLTLVSGLAHAAVCAEADVNSVTLCYKELSEACGRKTISNNPFVRAWEALSAAPSKQAADEAIQTTAAYFNLHRVQSVVLVANLQRLSDAERLGDIGAVALTADQSLRARAPTPGVPPGGAPRVGSASAKQRAFEAQHPTTYLAAKDGSFMSAMSADARSVTKVTLAIGLKGMMECMLQTSAHMLEFLQGEAQLAHLDDISLQELYEDDEKEMERLYQLSAADQSAEQLIPVRWDDVGYRMRSICWDTAAADCAHREDTNEDSAQEMQQAANGAA